MENPMRSEHAKKTLRISVGGSNRGEVQNGEVTWEKLIRTLSKPVVTPETYLEYTRSSAARKNDLKNCNGYWIGAHCEGGSRRRDNLSARDLVCFDIDNAKLFEGDLLSDLMSGETALNKYEFFIHSTRSHTPMAPRIRIVFPLAREVSVAEYEPLARYMARALDPHMQTVAIESFYPTQMMYYPSCSADMEDSFFHHLNPGELLDPEEFVEPLGDDWAHFENWPRIEGEESRQRADKAEWPLDKPGVIGAFCNAYNIHEAIEKFLPDVYAPSTAQGVYPRYTLIGGSGAEGAVVYDDGMFIYSHHGSDQLHHKNTNAYDMVRVHLFGGKDEKILKMEEHDRPPISQWPSSKEMAKFVMADPRVQTTKIARMVDPAAVFSDLGEEPESLVDVRSAEVAALDQLLSDLGAEPEVEDKTNLIGKKGNDLWLEKLELSETLAIKNTTYNGMLIASNDQRIAGAFAFNELAEDVVLIRPVKSRIAELPGLTLMDPEEGDRLQDHHIDWLRMFLDAPCRPKNAGYSMRMSRADVQSVVGQAAFKSRYHPVRRYLHSLTWDGIPRVDDMLIRYCGCPDNIYTREVSRMSLLGAVTRVHEPGHKFDTAVILEGKQGTRKSTMVQTIARQKTWFTELQADLSDKQKTVEQIQGFWIVELPELSTFNRRDANEIKQFMSGTRDTVRLAYRHNAGTYYRQCIFYGTVNDTQYLIDNTGNRRMWPIPVNVDVIDTDALDAEMDQVWAEALVMYQEMRKAQPKGTLPLCLGPEAEEIAQREQEMRVRTSQGEVAGANLAIQLDKPVLLSTLGQETVSLLPDLDDDTFVIRNFITPRMVWSEIYGKPIENMSKYDLWYVTDALKSVQGWSCVGRASSPFLPGGRETVYARTGCNWQARPYSLDSDDIFETEINGHMPGFCPEINLDVKVPCSYMDPGQLKSIPVEHRNGSVILNYVTPRIVWTQLYNRDEADMTPRDTAVIGGMLQDAPGWVSMGRSRHSVLLQGRERLYVRATHRASWRDHPFTIEGFEDLGEEEEEELRF